ncbi:hypothetical protein NUW58_g4203 [Xylaria curta]|uniref:Uncharacterized protein n=1 Tax=Xylaria curta TaxID=42375 RepID=A0ACC1P8C3_9PEZI|nr:hypothetical protein NUW58_g4203 [Xylaria curta]
MVYYTFFDLFRGDFSFSVQGDCVKQNIDLETACKISFDEPDGTVSAYGNVTRSHPLAANPDLAGLGIWLGLTTGILLSALALIFYIREVAYALVRKKGHSKLGFIASGLHTGSGSENDITHTGSDHIPFWTRFYRVLRALVILTADTQSVIALAYGINFGRSGKCTTSAYHYSMGLSTILCACTSITFSVLIVHDYWKAKVAAFLRFSVTAVIFAVQIRFQVYQYYRGFAAEPVGWFFYGKPAGNVDSTVLVPIACFLDPELDPLTGLSNAQIRQVGGRYNSRSQPEIYFSVFVAIIFLLGHLKHWLTPLREWARNRPEDSDRRKVCSNSNSKRVAQPEIVHLGGARVGTAFEALDLPAPDRSKPTERPLTRWAFNPPPPNPPGIGIAIADPEDSPKEIPNSSDLDSDRPLTQWFPHLQPGGEKNKNQPQHLQLRTDYPYGVPDTQPVEEELPSPLSPSSSSTATPNSTMEVSPLRSPVSSPTEFSEMNSSRPVQFPKRSTSLSQASRHAPRLTRRHVGNDDSVKVTEVHLRRTQSNAEIPRSVEWRSPPQLVSLEKFESLPVREASPYDLKTQEPQRGTRHSPQPLMVSQDSQVLPPLTSAPPNAPLPPISATKLAGQGKARDQLHRRGWSSSSDHVNGRSPPRELQEHADEQQPGTEQRLSSRERFWLHRHYRGEAMFLKAWGLEITNEKDREEGRQILRELMEGEAQEEREIQEKRMHYRSGSQSRSSTTTTSSSGRDGVSLDSIAEERLSREFHFHHPTAENRGYRDAAEEKFWRVEQETRDRGLKPRPGLDKHLRTESTDSVLGQYLDLRLSHN